MWDIFSNRDIQMAVLIKMLLNQQDPAQAGRAQEYFNYINRIADGLGVEPQDWMKLDESEWRLRKGCDYGTA